ncbi:hypothetical protein M569_01613, partial [Genlisea aurea]
MEKSDHVDRLYNRMRLWEFPDQYVVEPSDGSAAPFLSISRCDGSMKLIDGVPGFNSLHAPQVMTFFGVVGIRSYLFLITEREFVGYHLGFPIFKIVSLKVFPCNNTIKDAPVEQRKLESEFSQILNEAEFTHGLFFSYDVNITLSIQRLHALGDETKLLPLWQQADPQFLWNHYMLEGLIDNKVNPYILPVVQGSFQCFQSTVHGYIINVELIARRCTRRTGTRMWRRGADCDGFVANFLETEQIIQLNGGQTATFVQVRGSIPLIWEQVVDLTYNPKFKIMKVKESHQATERHFLDLRKKYGRIFAVDLINKHGREGVLHEKYVSAMQHVIGDDVRYLHFDFHKICGDTDFGCLSILYHQIEAFLLKNRYLLLNERGEKLDQQLGVVRTNCIDCLDRTNVTQSLIARKMLESQLRRLGVFNAKETISRHPDLDTRCKILWANHGDDISIQYSGTPALKGDFVRYGQRTFKGILYDTWSSLMRYYLNNFYDGTKQDAIDLLQGYYIVSLSQIMNPPRTKKKAIETIASIRLAAALVAAGFAFAVISLKRARHDASNLVFSMMWLSVCVAVASFVRANGRVFCNRPRL